MSGKDNIWILGYGMNHFFHIDHGSNVAAAVADENAYPGLLVGDIVLIRVDCFGNQCVAGG